MAARKRSSNRNYIDLVEQGNSEPRAAELSESGRPIRDYLLGFVAAMRSPRGDAR